MEKERSKLTFLHYIVKESHVGCRIYIMCVYSGKKHENWFVTLHPMLLC